MTTINKSTRLIALLLGLFMLSSLCTAIFADNLSPSPSHPTIVEGEDADGNDLTSPPYSDILVITPYSSKEEMRQGYKIDNFDIALSELTWEAAEFALADYMTPDMNPRNLTAVTIFYLHEKDDSKLVKLPARIRIATTLKKSDFVQLLAFRTRARVSAMDTDWPEEWEEWEEGDPDHSGYVWLRIPSTLYEDGTLEFIGDQFGSYAIITYRTQENTDPTVPTPSDPTKPSESTKPTTSGGGTPHSPQTGEPDSNALPAIALVLIACAAGALGFRKKQ